MSATRKETHRTDDLRSATPCAECQQRVGEVCRLKAQPQTATTCTAYETRREGPGGLTSIEVMELLT